ncbi:MAG: hypothetical protein BGN89_16330 [Alphaproteobacteria bacterium 64-6]|nr:PepSY domain-containing protein [Hyphomicrobium sp.]OJU24299.1 MAG: hypothetical protein BGN89_16330 [Alphaproteobacteria bacterium 64-6]
MKAASALAVLIVMLAGTAALADSIDANRVRALVERGEIMALEEILKRNEATLGGRVIEIELERKKDRYLYEIKVLAPNGRKREVKIDARTGAVVERD